MFVPEIPIEQFVAHFGYWAVFVIIGLESAGMPLPGEITLITAAIVAGTTHSLTIGGVLGCAIAGAVLGDNIGYWLGREFGFHLLVKHGGKIGIGIRQLKLGQFLFLQHGGKVVFFGRMFAVLRVLAAILAGVNRMPWPHFLACNVGGGLLWAIIYGGGAYLLGKQIKMFTGPVGALALMAAIVATLLGIRYIRSHQRTLEDRAEAALPGPLEARHVE